ncbi:tRNA(His) guanylyltransferase Thg1 family protein [Nitrosomonas sp. Nm33]|uniref:tRNA(His) guanylyltransferase Thg1 family protein n=1 Tax=Nitrosomonas sp. Nm33 TaxID=133724 RepID=UPI0008961069|nr:tRNA(His) guanylyltransferase Thg1 family protein [Nitrosomonas sp. Nm33]SDZ15835.1 tRNA(His) 5'-end guanylyltransferase [Nitrosomonas sp. Nm33]
MKAQELEKRMRKYESFRSVLIRSDAWTVIRLDGRSFTQFTARRFRKPYDERLRDFMIEAPSALMQDFQAIYCYTFSDEISAVFAPGWGLFNWRHEKLVSLSAGLVSSVFTHACGEPAHFDSRIWQCKQRDEVIDYFCWRQWDAARCALHGWCYWTLRQAGLSSETVVGMLDGKNRGEQKALLNQYDIDFDKVPSWQRHGVGLSWESYTKSGYDPIKAQAVEAERRRIKIQLQLASGKAYHEFLHDLLPY